MKQKLTPAQQRAADQLGAKRSVTITLTVSEWQSACRHAEELLHQKDRKKFHALVPLMEQLVGLFQNRQHNCWSCGKIMVTIAGTPGRRKDFCSPKCRLQWHRKAKAIEEAMNGLPADEALEMERLAAIDRADGVDEDEIAKRKQFWLMTKQKEDAPWVRTMYQVTPRLGSGLV